VRLIASQQRTQLGRPQQELPGGCWQTNQCWSNNTFILEGEKKLDNSSQEMLSLVSVLKIHKANILLDKEKAQSMRRPQSKDGSEVRLSKLVQ
jgi:hypothetical protein